MGDADKYTSAKSLLFEMEHTPFTRDIPPELLYESPYVTDAIGLLAYAADRQLNAD